MFKPIKVNEENKKEYYKKGYWSKDTLNDKWNDIVSQYGEKEYVADNTGVRFTYQEVDEKASRLAGWLKEIGIRNGDVVSFQCPPWSEFCVIYVACLKVGAVIHPISMQFNQEDLVYIMNLVESRAYFGPTFFRKMDYESQITGVAERIPSLLPGAICLMDKLQSSKGCVTLQEILAEYKPLTEKPESTSEDVALILCTSGTTNLSKGVLLSHNAVIASERSFAKAYDITREDVCFIPTPLNHATGFNHGLIMPMLLGGRSFLQQRFDAVEAIQIINREKATVALGATPFVFDILHCLERDHLSFDSLKVWICGGAPVPDMLIQRCHQHGVLLCESYGATESCPHAGVPPKNCLEWNGDWSGIAFESIEIKVVDEEGKEVPSGTLGEEISRGPHMFCGYLKNKEETDRSLTDDGWFKSGDICIQDEQGRIKVKGRKKEILIRGGENISANEVDYNLIGCPGVGAHSTIGMPDERLGERICTFVMVKDGITPTVKSVSEYLTSKGVAKRLWPEFIEVIDMLPATESGKIKRYELAKELERRIEERKRKAEAT